MRGSTLDDIDLQLLHLLQLNGRMSQHDLARAVGLSSPAVGERLRKLGEGGVIRQITAVLDPKKLGQDVTAFITVGIDGSRYYADFTERARRCPAIQECHAITGHGSHLLKVRAEDTTALERILAEIQSWPGVHWTRSSVVLSTAKETTHLPVLRGEGAGADAEGTGRSRRGKRAARSETSSGEAASVPAEARAPGLSARGRRLS